MVWEPLKLNRMVKSYQPDIMLSPRSGYRGDFECDEGSHEVTGKIVPVLWEKCMSVAQTWGYNPNDTVHSGENLIRMLVNTVCRGGNLLLNIGPDSEGVVPQSVKESLAILGDWMRENGDTIYGTRADFGSHRMVYLVVLISTMKYMFISLIVRGFKKRYC